MKTKMYAALVAFVAIAGLLSASTDVVAEPTCPGTGIECARSWDGTTYFKGAGQVELEQAN